MFYRNSIGIIFLLVNVFAMPSCNMAKTNSYQSPKEYNLNDASILYLDDALYEISGICFYPKDSSVFAISDGNGYLFKIHLTNNFTTQRWYFDKPHDFEDVFYKDSLFYVLSSDGNIHELKFSKKGDTIRTQTTIFDSTRKKENEFESLYYDPQKKYFVIICKNCENDKKKEVSAWAYYPGNGEFVPSVFKIKADEIAKKTGEKKLKFKPSAATINPLTGDLWILSSANEMLVVTDRDGNVKQAYKLNPSIFTQPEGITFTPTGDLIISNEAGNKYNRASLLIFKRKKVS